MKKLLAIIIGIISFSAIAQYVPYPFPYPDPVQNTVEWDNLIQDRGYYPAKPIPPFSPDVDINERTDISEFLNELMKDRGYLPQKPIPPFSPDVDINETGYWPMGLPPYGRQSMVILRFGENSFECYKR